MTTTEIQASGCYYLITKGASAAKWASGAPRKGVRDGNDNQSVILFDETAIREAIGSETLLEAELILTRDTEYGEALVSVTIAPAYVGAITDGYVTKDDALELARRELHHNASTQGAQATIRLPGATLLRLAAGEANALMLYQEDDGSDSYVRFTGTPVLKLHTGNDRIVPVWTRNIVKGVSTINSSITSFQADLMEMQFYINTQRTALGMAEMQDQTETIEDGQYETWGNIINIFRLGINDVLTHDDKEIIDWTIPDPLGLPQANIINAIRDAMGSGHQYGIESTSCFTANLKEDNKYKKIWGYSTDQKAEAGIYQTEEVLPGPTGPIHKYNKNAYCCGWTFNRTDITRSDGVSMSISVNKNEKSTVKIIVYGLLKMPESQTEEYAELIGTVKAGEMDCVSGDVNEIQINQDAIEKIRSGQYAGLALGYENERVSCGILAKLLL